jgi:hypothetical protein
MSARAEGFHQVFQESLSSPIAYIGNDGQCADFEIPTEDKKRIAKASNSVSFVYEAKAKTGRKYYQTGSVVLHEKYSVHCYIQ